MLFSVSDKVNVNVIGEIDDCPLTTSSLVIVKPGGVLSISIAGEMLGDAEGDRLGRAGLILIPVLDKIL